MRELFREILSANLAVTGILLTVGFIVIFFGSVYLLNWTNLGKKLAFLITGAATFGWTAINSLLFVLYAPRRTAAHRFRRSQCIRDSHHPADLHAGFADSVRDVHDGPQPFRRRTGTGAGLSLGERPLDVVPENLQLRR